MTRRMIVARAVLLVGMVAGAMSVAETLSFSWNPLFAAPALPEGATHTNYHAFREATLTIGVCLAIVFAMFQPARYRTRPLWRLTVLLAVGYYLGWWLPWPLLGLHTPNAVAEADHVLTAALVCAAVAVARPAFPTVRPGP